MNKKIAITLLMSIMAVEPALALRSKIGKADTTKKSAPAIIQKTDEEIIDEDENDQDLDLSTLDEDQSGGVEEAVHLDEQPVASVTDEEFSVQNKRKEVVALVERGADFLKKNDDHKAFHMFTHTKKFVSGELYLYVVDDKGVCLAHGAQTDLLWKNLFDLKDSYGTPFIKDVIEKAKQGGGWVTYEWRNATKVSYVMQVEKGSKRYAVACGYYPHSKEDAVVNLVKGAVGLFNQIKTEGRAKEEAFSGMSYPVGKFVYGDLYLFALDFKGIILAQGDRPGLIGNSAWDVKDPEGKFPNQEIINKLKERPNEGVWVSYESKRAIKKTYAERVVDAKGNNYFIACGFYPDATRDRAVDLVKSGYRYMKSVGKSTAIQDFTDKKNNTFRFGDLYLVAYDMQGKIIAHGGNPEIIGEDKMNAQDEDGTYYVKAILEKAKSGGGWIDFKINNSFRSTYVEFVDLGIDDVVITCGVYPITKSETTSLLLRSAMSALKTKTSDEAFAEFTNQQGSFVRGDLEVMVVDTAGLCYAAGARHAMIWQELINAKDDDGKPYIKTMINTVKQGPGKVTFKINGVQTVAFVDTIEKENKTFIVSSNFYK